MPESYRLFVRAPLILSIIALGLMGVFAKRGLVDWLRMVKQNELMNVKIAQIQVQRGQINWQVEQLQKNPEEQERVVRQFLGYIRPNETVIEYP